MQNFKPNQPNFKCLKLTVINEEENTKAIRFIFVIGDC